MTSLILKTSVKDRVRNALAKVFGQSIKPQYDQTLLREVPNINYDSLTALECIGAIEQEFGIMIDMIEDDVTYNFQSLENIQALVTKKLADNQALQSTTA